MLTEQRTAKLKTRVLSAKERRQNTVSKSIGGFEADDGNEGTK